MSKKNDSRIEAFDNIESNLEDNKAIHGAFVPIKNKRAALVVLMGELKKMKKDKAGTSEGLTKEKEATFEEMKAQALAIANVAVVWADDNKKHELIPALDLVKTDFNTSVSEAIDLVTGIDKALRPNLAALVESEITEDDLDKLLEQAADLQTVSPKPRQHIGKGKVKNDAYVAKIKEADIVVDALIRLITGKYLKTNIGFVNSFLASCRIYDPATRSTKLLIQVTDADGNALEGAWCDILQISDEEQYTDLTGKADIPGMRSGTFTIAISLEGYVTQTQIFTIKRSQKLKLEVKLVKA